MRGSLSRPASPERRLLTTELRQFMIAPRSLHLVPLLGAGILAVSWQFPPPPLLTAVIAGFAALEPQFDSILFRTPLEFQAMSLLPVNQEHIIRAKNLATIILAVCTAVIAASVFVFFSNTPVLWSDAGRAALLFLSLAFPLLHSGNRRSLQVPRRTTGWQTDDLIEGVGFLVTMAVLSLPYLLLVAALEQPLLCLLYTVIAAAYWWKRSIPATADDIDRQRVALCSNR